jgi:hypothetical protein
MRLDAQPNTETHMNDIPDNPYQSPEEHESGSPFVRGRRTRPGLILFAFFWAVVMFFVLPALSAPRYGPIRQSIEFQVITTFITVLAMVALARSVSGWRHLLVTPLWAILVFLEYLAWIRPKP